MSVLKALGKASVSTPQGRDLRTTLLTVLLALAVDEPNRVAAYKAGLIPLLVQMLGLKDDPVSPWLALGFPLTLMDRAAGQLIFTSIVYACVPTCMHEASVARKVGSTRSSSAGKLTIGLLRANTGSGGAGGKAGGPPGLQPHDQGQRAGCARHQRAAQAAERRGGGAPWTRASPKRSWSR